MKQPTSVPTLQDGGTADAESLRVRQRKLIHCFKAFLATSLHEVGLMNHAQTGRLSQNRVARATSFDALADSLDIEQSLTKLESVQASFVVVGAGDEDLNGQWQKLGDGSYCRIVDSTALATWNSQAKQWQMFYGDVVKYRLLVDSQKVGKEAPNEIPPISDDWEIVNGDGPAPVTRAIDVHQSQGPLFFEVFDLFWREDPPTFEEIEAEVDDEVCGLGTHTCHWRDLRGPYGESILSWLWILRSHDKVDKLQHLYIALTESILHLEPELAGVRLKNEPFVGQTVLHQAIAASDVELVKFMMNEPRIQDQPFFKDGLLEARLTGRFIANTQEVPAALQECFFDVLPPDDDPGSNGGSPPLVVACVAPTDDDKCLAILELLLDAGADPIFYPTAFSGEVMYNLLHVVAASSWCESHELSPLMSTSRTKMIIELFMSHRSKYFLKWGKKMQSQYNSKKLTPLQAAAMFGNANAFCELLDHAKVIVWEWGGKKEVGFPLDELDSGGDDARICALELMTLYRHSNLLSLNLTAEIVTHKWETFGLRWFSRCFVHQVACWCCAAFVCLDDTVGYSPFRVGARICLLTLALGYLATFAALFLLCGNNEQWFLHMDFSLFYASANKINFWQLLVVRNANELMLMVLLALLPSWYAGDHVRHSRFYAPVWHTIASMWFLSGISFFCSYLELFKSTSALALAIPEVARRDMIPFFALFIVTYLCCAVALRIAVATSASPSDRSFGSFWSVLKTLEEAMHGPDVQWRAAMEEQAQPAGAIFVIFLWLAIIMLSLLIAMFAQTFDVLKRHTTERLMFRRAMFCVTIEKLFPQWYYHHRSWGRKGCNIGSRLGLGSTSSDLLADPVAPNMQPAEDEWGFLSQQFRQYGSFDAPTSMFSRVGNAKAVGYDDRWLLWNKSASTFEKWRQPVEEHDLIKQL